MTVMTRSMHRAMQQQTKQQTKQTNIITKQYTEEEKETALPTLTSTLRSLNIWYLFIDNHEDYIREREKVEDFKRVLNKYNLSLEQKMKIVDDIVFDEYTAHSKRLLRIVLGIPLLVL